MRIRHVIWTAGFLAGTYTHALDILNYGWLPYEFRPLPWNLYWTSLVILDPLAAILVWVRTQAGLILGVAIMASNVLVNGYTAFVVGYKEFYFALTLQSLFALFVFWVAWRHWQSQPEQDVTEAR